MMVFFMAVMAVCAAGTHALGGVGGQPRPGVAVAAW
jgi:hypothetical protein